MAERAPQSSHRHGHSSHHRSSTRHFLLILGALLAVETVLMGAAAFRWKTANQESDALLTDQNRTRLDVEKLGPETRRLRQDVALLKAGRLPGLQPLQPDQVVEVGKSYVKSLVLSQAGPHSIEYTLSLMNESLNIVRPDITLQLFNGNGVQVGWVRIAFANSDGPMVERLDPGQIRTIGGRLDWSGPSGPDFYRLVIGG
jgi:hypothetical protein